MFRDRTDAGAQLAGKLVEYRGDSRAVVLGIPRGGVVVADVVARELDLALDLVVVRKIGAPGNPEYAVGAVDEDGDIVRNPAAPVSEEYLRAAAAEDRVEIERRVQAYRGGRPAPDVRGKTAILVDDGIATGLTARAAIRFLKREGAARVVLAVPVIARSSAEELRREADDLVSVEEPLSFFAVGQFYDVFDQTTDDEVRKILAESAARSAPTGM